MPDKYKFSVCEREKIRIIIDTDAACEADDQYAIVHALLTPCFKIAGIIAEQFCSEGGERSVDRSFAEIEKILVLMDIDNIPVFRGAYAPLESEDDVPDSEAVDFIINEAMKDNALLCQGALTNVAAAINKAPCIADRFTCIWIGGECWGLGDSPALGLALNPGCGHFEVRNAPAVNSKGEYTGETENKIRVYHDIDTRFILEDFFTKLKIAYD